MDPERLMQLAEQALAEGTPLDEVVDLVRSKGEREGLGGDLGMAFRNRIESRELAEEAETLSRVAERGPVSNFAAMGLNALFAGQLGSLIERFGGEGTSGEVFRETVRETREASPSGALASEAAGGVAVPAMGLFRLGQGGGTAARIAGGGGVGGGLAGLMGFGEASGTTGERIAEGVIQAPAGVLLGGGAAGLARPFARSRVGRSLRGRRSVGPRIAEELEETSGLTRDINRAREIARTETQRVSNEFFAPLDEQFSEVVHADVREFLTDNPDVRSAVNAVSREIFRDNRPPSFTELRLIRDRLWKNQNTKNQGDVLQDIMLDIFPGFREGNAAFRAAKDIEDALSFGLGEKTTTFNGQRIRVNTAANVDEALRILPPESHDAFRTGLLQRVMNRISSAESGAGKDVQILRTLLDDVGTDGKLRALFPDDKSAEQFIRLVKAEASGRTLRRFMRNAGLFVAGATVTGAVGGAVVGALSR